MSCETLVEGENGKDGFLAIVSFNGRRQQTDAVKKRKKEYIPLGKKLKHSRELNNKQWL